MDLRKVKSVFDMHDEDLMQSSQSSTSDLEDKFKEMKSVSSLLSSCGKHFSASTVSIRGTINDDNTDSNEMSFEYFEEDLKCCGQKKHVDFALRSEVDISEMQEPYSQSQHQYLKLHSKGDVDGWMLDNSNVSSDSPQAKRLSVGSFVDPLSGVQQDDNADSSYFEETEEEQNSDASFDEHMFEKYDKLYAEYSMNAEKSEETYEATVLNFLSTLTCNVKNATTDQKHSEKELEISTKVYLDNLLDNVVQSIFQKIRVASLSEKLDKRSMLEELMNIYYDRNMERNVNKFLAKKAILHYSRKGKTSYILTGRQKSVDPWRYLNICHELDELLGREAVVEYKTGQRISELTNEAKNCEETEAMEYENFENLVRKTLKCESRRELLLKVNSELEKIAQLKKEISLFRSKIIHYQHLLSALENQERERERITENLSIADFDYLNEHIYMLERKIGDRQADQNKLRRRFRKNAHTTAHTKAKTHNRRQQLNMQRQRFFDLENAELEYRERIFEDRLKRERTRGRLKDLTRKSGLLAYPLLMHDYDETLKILDEKHMETAKLRLKYSELMEKLKKHEELASSTELSNKSVSLKPNPKKPAYSKGFV